MNNRKEDEFIKTLKEFMSNIDTRIENKANRLILKHLEIKWHTLIIGLASVTILFSVLISVNKATIDSNIKTTMRKYNEKMDIHNNKMDSLELKLNQLLNAKMNRDPNSPFPAIEEPKDVPVRKGRAPTSNPSPIYDKIPFYNTI